jgi:hypothetical protein
MRTKLKLNLEQLTVDSFDTSASEKPRGTVFGEQCTCYTNCTCPGCPTCDASCNGTCGGTCAGSCYGTCDATCNTCAASCYGSCDGYCTQWDATCRNIGTCNGWYGAGCPEVP